MSSEHVPLSERIELAQTTGITLDGEPAGIGGYTNQFAGVRRRDGKGGVVEFAWSTVRRIVNSHGRFES